MGSRVVPTYWVPQILPQIYTAIAYICIGYDLQYILAAIYETFCAQEYGLLRELFHLFDSFGHYGQFYGVTDRVVQLLLLLDHFRPIREIGEESL